MGRIEKSIEIRAPPEKVWEMLAVDRHLEWMEEWKSVKYISEVQTPEDKYRVGASARVTQKHGEFDLEIEESLENEKIMLRSKELHFTVTYILKPVDGGTKLTWVGELEMRWGILGKALSGIFIRMEEKGIQRGLEKLKSILEK